MDKMTDYKQLNSLLSSENHEDLDQVCELLDQYFDAKGIMGEIGRLIAELTIKGNGFDLVKLHMGEVFEPNIFERDQFYSEVQKADNELFKIHQAMNKIANREAETVEIQIKFNKGKRSAETIIIQHEEVLPLIFKLLDKLPDGRPIEKRKKGSPEKKEFKQFMQESIKKCINLIEPTNHTLTETDKLFFAGLVLSLAGIMPPPKHYNDGFKIESHQIQIYKEKLSDDLKYYKPAGK